MVANAEVPTGGGASSTTVALEALRRAIYLLDRGLAPRQKVRAFSNAMGVIADLDPTELEARTTAGTLTRIPGIGPSTASVITDALQDRPGEYLARLDAETACEPTVGAELRELIRSDLHCHTTWSDGGASVLEMARTARDLGHDYLAITDHSPRLTVAHGLSVDRLREQLREIDAVRDQVAPLRILTGMEVDILADGSLDLPEELLAELDIVVASVHSKLRMERRAMTERMVRAVSSPHVDVLGHCTGRRILGTPRPPSAFDAGIVFMACAEAATAVEINCRPERQDPPRQLLGIADELGCNFSIDTDAHAPGQMEWQGWGCDLATEAGIDPARIINTWSAEDLLGSADRIGPG